MSDDYYAQVEKEEDEEEGDDAVAFGECNNCSFDGTYRSVKWVGKAGRAVL